MIGRVSHFTYSTLLAGTPSVHHLAGVNNKPCSKGSCSRRDTSAKAAAPTPCLAPGVNGKKPGVNLFPGRPKTTTVLQDSGMVSARTGPSTPLLMKQPAGARTRPGEHITGFHLPPSSQHHNQCEKTEVFLGVDSPFCSTIVLFKNGFLERMGKVPLESWRETERFDAPVAPFWDPQNHLVFSCVHHVAGRRAVTPRRRESEPRRKTNRWPWAFQKP